MDFVQFLLDNNVYAILKDFSWISLAEVVIIILFLLPFYLRFIRHSSSRKLFNSIISIVVINIFSKFLIAINLFIIGRFLEAISFVLLLSFVVIFQPELRRFLGYLSQPGFIHKTFFTPIKEETHNVDFVKELSETIKYLSKSKIGALMVFQETEDMGAYSEIGTKIHSIISSELILTIFHPNTALHDGAMVLTPQKIIAAGVLLPLTEDPELSWQYGTRHRAAIGITEISEHTCIVVSEETGSVSVVKNGKLKKIDTIENLQIELHKIIAPKETNKKKKKNSSDEVPVINNIE